ncbi:MAG: ANTAR domain-containing protein [Actinobacteria bacterium]|nr:ANTAR domain-containing protein [Actinomycetota bacterium]
MASAPERRPADDAPPVLAPEAARLVRGLREEVAELRETNGQLEHALRSRIVIEQAKGILAERLQIGVEDAFALLRRASRDHQVKLHSLARAVVDSPTSPAELRSDDPGPA